MTSPSLKTTASSTPTPANAKPLKLGIAGMGVVGSAVVQLIHRQRSALMSRTGRLIDVVAVSARDPNKDRGFDKSALRFVKDPVALATDPEIDLFVELIGGADGIAKDAVISALKAGKPVVTANKALLANHGLELATLAEARHVALAFEASVAGGIPVVKTLREGLAGNVISRISGILNGTCNYILSRMESDNLDFAECLQAAQKLGYAEADPTFDIGGFDTAHKLAILSSLAFGTRIDADAVHIEGIEHITSADIATAKELGYRIKLLGVAERRATGQGFAIEQRVHPTMVPRSAPIAQAMGVTNAVMIEGDSVRDLTLTGPGAGGEATASAVVADIADIARGVRTPPFGLPVASLETAPRIAMQRHEGGYFVRLQVADRTGAVAAIATRFADHKISLESIVQKGEQRRVDSGITSVPVSLITYATTEEAVRTALSDVLADGHVVARPQLIRIERE